MVVIFRPGTPQSTAVQVVFWDSAKPVQKPLTCISLFGRQHQHGAPAVYT